MSGTATSAAAETSPSALAHDLYADTYGTPATGLWSAPGRVNLIGEHTDYNNGFVLPFAIDRRTWCAVGERADRSIVVTSTLTGDDAQISLDALAPERLQGWSAYVFGVIWALGEHGVDLTGRQGLNLAFASNVPLGAGLSSSAAIECSVAVAVNELWDLGISSKQLAKVCQLAENKAVGAPTGIMDQTASLLGQPGHAVLLDCDSYHSELVPLALSDAGLAVLVIDTRVTHAHATGGYAARRESCERAARELGVVTLRELTEVSLPQARTMLDPETFRRVRHIATENARVLETARVLHDAGPRAIGDLLVASHASMRDDFEISVPQLDLAVETAMAHGAVGARMTGGGFGGAAIALAPIEMVDAIGDQVTRAYADAKYEPPVMFTVAPAGGAGRDA
ncbi:MAG: galactokinase [Actinobacteria bacterium HGW-Actinobacteria-4]|nr:MAG: galactokinase [Actinobacteria bacterium HGW-Actinobacteria-4]